MGVNQQPLSHYGDTKSISVHDGFYPPVGFPQSPAKNGEGFLKAVFVKKTGQAVRGLLKTPWGTADGRGMGMFPPAVRGKLSHMGQPKRVARLGV
jgi:hypothetical protein